MPILGHHHAKFPINTHLNNPFRYFTIQLNQVPDRSLWNTHLFASRVLLKFFTITALTECAYWFDVDSAKALVLLVIQMLTQAKSPFQGPNQNHSHRLIDPTTLHVIQSSRCSYILLPDMIPHSSQLPSLNPLMSHLLLSYFIQSCCSHPTKCSFAAQLLNYHWSQGFSVKATDSKCSVMATA